MWGPRCSISKHRDLRSFYHIRSPWLKTAGFYWPQHPALQSDCLRSTLKICSNITIFDRFQRLVNTCTVFKYEYSKNNETNVSSTRQVLLDGHEVQHKWRNAYMGIWCSAGALPRSSTVGRHRAYYDTRHWGLLQINVRHQLHHLAVQVSRLRWDSRRRRLQT